MLINVQNAPKHDHSKQNNSGMIVGTHATTQWPNQGITPIASLPLKSNHLLFYRIPLSQSI